MMEKDRPDPSDSPILSFAPAAGARWKKVRLVQLTSPHFASRQNLLVRTVLTGVADRLSDSYSTPCLSDTHVKSRSRAWRRTEVEEALQPAFLPIRSSFVLFLYIVLLILRPRIKAQTVHPIASAFLLFCVYPLKQSTPPPQNLEPDPPHRLPAA